MSWPIPKIVYPARGPITTVTLGSGGTGGTYLVNDILTVLQNGASGGSVKVTTVSGGVITGITIQTAGVNYGVATGLATTGGGGTGATVNITSIGSTTTLSFTYPPVGKAGPHDGTSDMRSAKRHDTVTISGVKQSIFEHSDIFRTIQMENVPMTDLAAWSAFIDFAIQGSSFLYYPDGTLTAYVEFTLEDTDWDPKMNVRTLAKFSLRMRKVVSGLSHA